MTTQILARHRNSREKQLSQVVEVEIQKCLITNIFVPFLANEKCYRFQSEHF